MIFAGGRMLLTSGAAKKERKMPLYKPMILTGLAGFFVGFITGILGVGGGLFVPMMIAIGYPLHPKSG